MRAHAGHTYSMPDDNISFPCESEEWVSVAAGPPSIENINAYIFSCVKMIPPSSEREQVKPRYATFYKCTFPGCTHRRRQGLYHMKRHVVQVHKHNGRPMIRKRKLRPEAPKAAELHVQKATKKPQRLASTSAGQFETSEPLGRETMEASLSAGQFETSEPLGRETMEASPSDLIQSPGRCTSIPLFERRLGCDMDWNIRNAQPFEALFPGSQTSIWPSSILFPTTLDANMQFKIIEPVRDLLASPRLESFSAESWVFSDSPEHEICTDVW